MDVSTALRLQSGDVVAFVGAGGKTSCIQKNISELSQQMLVIATTTTKLAAYEASLAAKHYVIQTSHELDEALCELSFIGAALFTGPMLEQEEKWTALDPADLTRLVAFTKEQAGIVLIEADGAKGAKIKAPAAHEPVIPPETTIVVPLLRIDALGIRSEDRQVHRPELLTELLGMEQNQPLSIEHLAGLISHEQGGLKGIPVDADVRVFVNAVDSNELTSAAQMLASMLIEEDRIRSVLIGSLHAADPVPEVWGKTGVIVLAAGGSKRFGAPKLLQSWQGKPILRQVVEMIVASDIRPAVVVLGSNYEEVEGGIVDLGIPTLKNPSWSRGQSSSVKVGLESIQDKCEAVIFVLGDMPDVDHELLKSLVETHRRTLHAIIAPFAGDRWGNPVLFDKCTFDDFNSLDGDRGGRALFDRYPPLSIPADASVLFDIDTPDDLAVDD